MVYRRPSPESESLSRSESLFPLMFTVIPSRIHISRSIVLFEWADRLREGFEQTARADLQGLFHRAPGARMKSNSDTLLRLRGR